MALFAAWAVGSTVWSPLIKVSLSQSFSFSLLMSLALVIGVSWRGVEDTSRILFLLSVSLLGIAIVLIGLRLGFPRYGALTRASSGIFHSTSAGATSSLATVILLAASLLWRWPWAKTMAAPGLIVHLTVFLLAGNRLSFAIAILLAGCVLVWTLAAHRIATIALALGILGGAYFVVDTRLVQARNGLQYAGLAVGQGQSSKSLESLSGRSEMWKAMGKSYWDSPWMGHGYFVTSEKGSILVWDEWGNWTAHNWFLQAVVTTGAIGATLLIGGNLWLAFSVFRNRQRDPQLAFLLGALLVWFIAWGGLNASYLGPLQPESVVFSVGVGLAVSLAIRKGDEEAVG